MADEAEKPPESETVEIKPDSSTIGQSTKTLGDSDG